jgi:hypothetical protein
VGARGENQHHNCADFGADRLGGDEVHRRPPMSRDKVIEVGCANPKKGVRVL